TGRLRHGASVVATGLGYVQRFHSDAIPLPRGENGMADLIAQGITTQNRWRRTLPDSQQVLLGRSAEPWAGPWDAQISRRHAEGWWRGGKLPVRRVPTARNPLFVRGQRADAFELRPGECFVSGETTFTVTDEEAATRLETLAPIQEQTFRAQDLARIRFRD